MGGDGGLMGLINFSVRFDGVAAVEAKIERGASKAEEILAYQVRDDTAKYVPYLTGSLDNRTRVNRNTVIYPGPYARFLHGGLVMVDPVTGSPFARKGVTKILTDKPLKFNKSGHQNATAHWIDVSKRANLPKWERVAANAIKAGLNK